MPVTVNIVEGTDWRAAIAVSPQCCGDKNFISGNKWFFKFSEGRSSSCYNKKNDYGSFAFGI